MHRYLMAVVLGTGLSMLARATPAQTAPATCTADIAAAIAQACPCGTARNHGQFMKCVRRELETFRKSNCDVKVLAKANRCAAASVCGKPHSPLICCDRHGRAKLAAADKCTAKGGKVMTGAASICDVACPAVP